jgi:uncharacterized membrane protein
MTLADTANTTRDMQHSAGERAIEGQHPQVNIGSQERLISAGAGALLAVVGVKRGGLGGIVLAVGGAMLIQRALSGHRKLYEALGINRAERDDGAPPEAYFDRGIHVVEKFTISKSPEELYAFWRNFENLPRFMQHLESVRCEGNNRSHWVAKGPAGFSVEWNAEIINDEPNRVIAWRSLGGTDVDNAGSVRFTPARGDRGTQVSVNLDYIPPAGRAGALIAKLFGRDPERMVREDLRRFKQLMETGEIPTTEGQPRGSCGG